MTDEKHEHLWWHAPNVEFHLVCLTCGKGLSAIEERIDINNIPHSTIGLSLVDPYGKIVGCNRRHPLPF